MENLPINLKLYDLIKRTKCKKYLYFFLKSRDWTKIEIRNYQLSQLQKLINYAYEFVPYYKNIFKENKIFPNHIKTLDDLGKIPFLDRTDIQDNYENIISREKKFKKIYKSSSSGTTGIPIKYIHDIEGESAGIAAGFFCNYLSGWKIGLRSIHIWGNIDSIKRWKKFGSKLKQKILCQKNIPSIILNNEKNYLDVIKIINNYKPDSIDGYSSSIANLARFIQEHNIKIHRPRFILTTAENLFEHDKEIIEKVFAPVSDIYGCGEINGIAAKPIKNSKYFIIEPHVIVEAISVKGQNYKEIAVTDLDNRIMPFIRYKVGDLIDGIYENNESEELRYNYFNNIMGRSTDLIELGKGLKISPVTVFGGTLFRNLKGIKKHKVIWNGIIVKFLFEIGPDFNLSKTKNILRNDLKKYGIEFEIKTTKKILPDKNGKYKYFEMIKE